MRRIFISLCAITLFIVSFPTYGQGSDYYFNRDLLIKNGEYCRSVRYEFKDMTARQIRQRTVSEEFWNEFGLDFWLTGFKGTSRTGSQGHIYNYREETTGMLFSDITYGYSFLCSDGILEITLCHVIPGYARRSSLFPWRYWWQELPAGAEALDYFGIDRHRVKKWQLGLIRYMDQFFEEQAPKMRDFLLTHPSAEELLQLKEASQ